MHFHLFTNKDLKNILEEENCELVKKIIIETKERTLRYELRE